MTEAAAPIATFSPEALFPNFSLELFADRIEITFPVNYCCHVSVKREKLELDRVMDVTLNNDKYYKPFGLKQIDVWAYGDDRKTGPSASIPWIADADQAREAIQLAISLRKAATGRVPWPPDAISASLEEVPAASAGARGDAGGAPAARAGGGVAAADVRPEVVDAPAR
ncbi:hypothetical protein GPECTOR_39g392 [Gonium pectorale]|uniref:Uncharacterized protein n=1 Tax=Gonium pectorale TaxID=33097 RepID=A0A150GAP9_GONPE|nr:hypothetical protein GPECTOR_39g392 [Gonium pectorale]|eukprot:KXZ46898.1 hypothetical protein GPECTOR_39g392 [Gonium pectorale]